MELKKVTLKQITSLILQAEENKSFNPSLGSNKSIIDELNEISNDKEFHVFAFFKQNKAIAFTTSFPNNVKGRISIGYTYVEKHFRGLGIGDRLIKEIINWVKDQGYKEVYIKTWKRNTSMVKICEKHGFELIDEVENDREDGDSTLKFLLSLKINSGKIIQ